MGVSAREAAKQLKLTHPAILKAAKDGRITRESDGTFDVEKIRRQLVENSNALKRRKTAAETANQPNLKETPQSLKETLAPDPDSELRTLAEAQRQREWVRLQKEQLDLARKRGELAPIGEVNAWAAGMIIRARDILTRIGPELKDRLAQTVDPHECEALVDGEVRRALEQLSEFKPQPVE